jgi:hypothetical protein
LQLLIAFRKQKYTILLNYKRFVLFFINNFNLLQNVAKIIKSDQKKSLKRRNLETGNERRLIQNNLNQIND